VKRIAVVATIYRHLSHAQHIIDRFLLGYPWEGRWHRPDMKVVSLYVDQRPVGDQSQDRAREFGFTVYPTITEALCCGGSELDVDAVLIIGEHGEYPKNDLDQKLYPRYEFFKECISVFEKSGSSVPIYNDKHLSYSFEKAKEMVDDAHRLEFPLLSGSSLPVTWRLPDLELPIDCSIDAALTIGIGGSDIMDYHVMETMQAFSERRMGGETGVRSVQLLDGDAVWKAEEEGRWDNELLEAALSRCDRLLGLTDEDGRTQDMLGSGELKRIVEKPSLYSIEHSDGFESNMLLLPNGLKDTCFAARLKGDDAIHSCQIFTTPIPNVTYSASLVSRIEEMIVTGVSPIPAERTLIVCGMLESCLKSRHQDHVRLETPHLDVTYRSPETPQHAHT